MRHETAGADVAVLDLLARADALSAAAVVAIEQGDDSTLIELLDQRGAVVDAAVSAWNEASAAGPTADMTSRVVAAMQRSLRLGNQAQAVAVRGRADAATELSTLDARRTASVEYQLSPVHSAINVVL